NCVINTPSRARRSRFGVWIFRLPITDRSPKPMSSTSTNKILGLSAAADGAELSAAGAAAVTGAATPISAASMVVAAQRAIAVRRAIGVSPALFILEQ